MTAALSSLVREVAMLSEEYRLYDSLFYCDVASRLSFRSVSCSDGRKLRGTCFRMVAILIVRPYFAKTATSFNDRGIRRSTSDSEKSRGDPERISLIPGSLDGL